LKRQQRWDLSFWDVNFEVRWTLIGYHPDGKLVASQPVKVGDELVATNFVNSITSDFAAVGEPDVAVCLLPGTLRLIQQ